MSASVLLGRLEHVRRTGAGRWIARCPSHSDKRPSLSIRELDDSRVLLHCFAGCGVEEVLNAVSLDFDALYPERALSHHKPPLKKPWRVSDVVRALEYELTIACIALGDVEQGRPVTDRDRARYGLCRTRICHFLGELQNAS
jgi:hypothetical protein